MWLPPERGPYSGKRGARAARVLQIRSGHSHVADSLTSLPLPFEFVIDGPPVSQQTRRRERYHDWKADVRRVAEQSWPSAELPVTEPVMLTITYFYDETSMDVDNIPKPISDALNGLVYVDDSRVNDVLCRRRDLSAGLRVRDPSPVLASGFDRRGEFLHVIVDLAPDQEVIL